MHCCYGNHILDTHWYGSLFAFADEMLRLGARPAGSLMGSKVVERIGKEERGEGRGEMERRRERRMEGRRKEERKAPRTRQPLRGSRVLQTLPGREGCALRN